MNDEQMNESLSALMDGELAHARAERVLDRVLGDAELRERWRRNHLISAALSSQHSTVVADDDLAARVSAALDAEPAPLRKPARRLSWTVGLAAAASVATLAVVVVLSITTQQSTPPVPPLAELNAPAALPHQGPAVATVALNTGAGVTSADPAGAHSDASGSALTRMTWNDARPAVEARLNSYLLDHNEYLADGVRGMLPYARVVGYDTRN